jgi:hypothetical protein
MSTILNSPIVYNYIILLAIVYGIPASMLPSGHSVVDGVPPSNIPTDVMVDTPTNSQTTPVHFQVLLPTVNCWFTVGEFGKSIAVILVIIP